MPSELPGASPLSAVAAEGFMQLPGARLWYWDTGGGGEPIIFCHPASQSAEIWGYQQVPFSARGYRMIAYSRRGYGRSENGAGLGTSVGDLRELLSLLKIDRAHILGAAAGGITALAFAVAEPHRVRTLTLAGTIFAPDEPQWRDAYARLDIAAVRAVVSTEFLELGPAYRMSNPAGTKRFAELSEAALSAGPVRQPSGIEVNWAAMAAMTHPALLLTGEADLYAPPPLQAMIASHLPSCETVTLREVGHAAYWEAPDAFNTTVLDFLDRHRAGTGTGT